jgi:predicted thioesterase
MTNMQAILTTSGGGGDAIERIRGDGARPTPGDTRVMQYLTSPADCVQTTGVGREWSDKPPVVASCVLVRLSEQVCMQALLESMPDEHCSLGVLQQLQHHAPAVVGAEIVLTAHLTRVHGRHTSWHVTIEDRHETIASGRMDFVTVHRPSYESRRLAAKHLAIESVGQTAA